MQKEARKSAKHFKSTEQSCVAWMYGEDIASNKMHHEWLADGILWRAVPSNA